MTSFAIGKVWQGLLLNSGDSVWVLIIQWVLLIRIKVIPVNICFVRGMEWGRWGGIEIGRSAILLFGTIRGQWRETLQLFILGSKIWGSWSRNNSGSSKHVLIVLGFNDTSTLMDHFVSFPREREKRDRRDSRRDEREGQGRKRNRNESEETEEIKTSPPYPYLLQRKQALPNCKPISAGRPGDIRYMTCFSLPVPGIAVTTVCLC